jgi:hypothetical protein
MAEARQLPETLPSDNRPSEIPSEYIEPYLKNFMMVQLEYFNYCNQSHEETLANLKGVERFISHYGGLHSRMAVSNIYYTVYNQTEEKLREFCIEIFGS